jgi:hypothetical protein
MSEFQRCTECEKPQNTDYGGRENKCHPNFMADGRSFGDQIYSGKCQSQYQMQIDNQIISNFEYRQYLIQNAESIMRQNIQKASQNA